MQILKDLSECSVGNEGCPGVGKECRKGVGCGSVVCRSQCSPLFVP